MKNFKTIFPVIDNVPIGLSPSLIFGGPYWINFQGPLPLKNNNMKCYRITLVIIFMTIYGCNEKKSVDLGRGYRFDNDPSISMDYMIFGVNKNIYGNILDFNFDSIFIIVEQMPRDLIMKDINTNLDMTFKEQEKKFKESSLRQFWVINKIKDSIYGPFDRQEYLQKREELGVSKGLELKE